MKATGFTIGDTFFCLNYSGKSGGEMWLAAGVVGKKLKEKYHRQPN